jgi:polyphenol oxidase
MSGADFLSSGLLAAHGFQNAFFTRRGGVSGGPYASLNFSISVGDAPDNVQTNRGLAAAALGVDRERLYFLSQVHGKRIVELTGAERLDHVFGVEGDALVSSDPTLACGVRTADCVPILIADLTTGRAAAIHAGWRGVSANIAAAALAELGGYPDHWLAAIGPHISVDAFEVGADVAAELARCSKAEQPILREQDGKAWVNLRQIVRAQLASAGVLPHHVEDVVGCTHSDAERFFSFRRDGQISGRHLSAIRPREARR